MLAVVVQYLFHFVGNRVENDHIEDYFELSGEEEKEVFVFSTQAILYLALAA